jgi:hypothetical protein
VYHRDVRSLVAVCVLIAAARHGGAQPAASGSATEERIAAERACAAREPTCDWVMTYSSLERATIRRALDALGVEVEPSPWGKTIGQIRIHNEDVFAEANWLRFFNVFHVTSRDRTIRVELTIREGEPWDDDRVLETARRVRDPMYTSVVAVIPIKSAVPGMVDALVVTRDIWSLRLNTEYTIQENSLTNLVVSLSENNFLGRRMTIALAMVMDQGAISLGPLFIDKNFLGLNLDFRVRVERILTRRSLDVIAPDGTRMPTGDPVGLQDGGVLNSEGSGTTVTFARPLWSLASRWGAGTVFTHRDAVARQFFRTGLRSWDDPTTPEVEAVARQFRMRTWSTKAHVNRQWGDSIKHRFEAGYTVVSQTPSLLPSFPADEALRASFAQDVFPRTEVISQPYVEYGFFQAKFRTLRNVDTFELAEDIRFGPNLTVGLAQSLRPLGATFTFTRPSLVAGWTFPWCRDGFFRASAGAQMRIQGGRTIDNTATWTLRASTPTYGWLRVLGQSQMQVRWHDTQNQFYALGSEAGLRGYGVGQVIGDRRFLTQLEVRTVPVPFWVLRFGAVVFYDGGGAADTLREMRLLHDVGFGLRMLVPQTSRQLFRFDLAVPLVDAPGTPAYHPRFVAGFDSYF